MYVGYSGRKIELTSLTKLHSDRLKFIKVNPSEVKGISAERLIAEYEVVDGKLRHKDSAPPKSDLRVAMVTSYKNNCGMSTYAEALVAAMAPKVKELHVYAEYVTTEDLSDNPPNVRLTRCWDRKEGIYSQIITEVALFDPDVIFVQHEYGSFHHPRNWNTLIGHLSSIARTVIVLHSIYDHVDKLIFEGPCQEIITHSLPGRDLLKSKGVDHCPVHYIPHGCPPLESLADKKYHHSKMPDEVTFFQYGFGFEYKGWTTAIDIMDSLKREGLSDASYIGVFNVSQYAKAANLTYLNTLMRQIKERGLQEQMVLHRGFRSQEILLSYMQQARVNLFPYWNHHEWRVYGASGAVRLALSSGTPTIVGDVPFFDEFKGVIPVCSTIQQYTDEIKSLVFDSEYREHVLERQRAFVAGRSWNQIADWYLDTSPLTEFTANPVMDIVDEEDEEE